MDKQIEKESYFSNKTCGAETEDWQAEEGTGAHLGAGLGHFGRAHSRAAEQRSECSRHTWSRLLDPPCLLFLLRNCDRLNRDRQLVEDVRQESHR